MFAALIPLALTLAPAIGKWLFGATGDKVATVAAEAVQAVTGCDPTTDAGAKAAQAALDANPALASQLRVQLAQIAAQQEAEADREQDAKRQAELDTIRAQLTDVASARDQTIQLAKSRSAIAWGSPVVSVVILGAFGFVLYLALTRTLPEGSSQILSIVIGTLTAMATQVANYWLGSSHGSQQKDAALAASVPSAVLNLPVQAAKQLLGR